MGGSKLDQDLERKVLMGTCGWSDESLLRCGKLYPASVKTAEDRLAIYSKHFACVEVDSSCYAIPKPAHVRRWVEQTPSGFKFHFKAFGAFCAGSVPCNALPWEVRCQLAPGLHHSSQHVSVAQLPAGSEERLWRLFHEAIEPAKQAQRLGLVVFQFHLGFKPSEASRQAVMRCRQRLAPDIAMAAEFRNRAWFQSALEELSTWLAAAGIVLVAADELQHETFQKDRQQVGLLPGQVRQVMPIALAVTSPQLGCYVRVHRRHGTLARQLEQKEIEAWSQRLQALASTCRGPLYFLWGTDWEDVPLVNGRALQQALQQELRCDWGQRVRSSAAGSLHAFFGKARAGTGKASGGSSGSAPLPPAEANPPAGGSTAGTPGSTGAAGMVADSSPAAKRARTSASQPEAAGSQVSSRSSQRQQAGRASPGSKGKPARPAGTLLAFFTPQQRSGKAGGSQASQLNLMGGPAAASAADGLVCAAQREQQQAHQEQAQAPASSNLQQHDQEEQRVPQQQMLQSQQPEASGGLQQQQQWQQEDQHGGVPCTAGQSGSMSSLPRSAQAGLPAGAPLGAGVQEQHEVTSGPACCAESPGQQQQAAAPAGSESSWRQYLSPSRTSSEEL